MVEGGRTPLLSPAELHDLGFDLIVHPLAALLTTTKALQDMYGRLREKGTLRDDLQGVASFDDFNALIDLERHYELEKKYR
jgi:methylisocitrate lyase